MNRELLGGIASVAFDPSEYAVLMDAWVDALDEPSTGLITLAKRQSFLDALNRASLLFEVEFDDHISRYTASIDDDAVLFSTDAQPVSSNDPLQVGADCTLDEACTYLELTRFELRSFLKDVRLNFWRDRICSVTNEAGRQTYFHCKALKLQGSRFVLVRHINLSIAGESLNAIVGSFGLTRAEGHVLGCLLRGLERSEIAKERGVTGETIKKQISSILKKCGTKNRYELIALASAFSKSRGQLARRSNDSPEAPYPDYAKGTLKYASLQIEGRKVEYHVIGHPTGKPVLLLHGSYGFCRLTKDMEADIRRAGLRFICVIRPGYGDSSEVLSGADRFNTLFNDALAVLRKESIKTLSVLSLENDIWIGARMASQRPDMFRAHISCAGLLPLERPEYFDGMHPWHKVVLKTAQKYPSLAYFPVKAGFKYAQLSGRERFLRDAYTTSAADIATLENQETLDAILQGTLISVSPSHIAHRAFSAELAEFASKSWRTDLVASKGQVDMTVLYGSQDPAMSQVMLDGFRADYPWIDIQYFENAGQFIVFQKWKEVLRLLSAKADL